LAASLSAGIARDARELLGGDVEAQLAYRPATAEEQVFLAKSGALSEVPRCGRWRARLTGSGRA
jgi:putative ABC transport system permease protein